MQVARTPAERDPEEEPALSLSACRGWSLLKSSLSCVLVLAPGVAPDRVRERIPFIQERVTPYFLGRTAAELATPEGFEQARRELSAAVELIYSKAEVERVVVSQLVVQ